VSTQARRLSMATAVALGLALSSAGVALVARAQEAAPLPPALRANQVFEKWDRRDSPGCAVSIGRGGRIVFSRAYGMANLEYDVPLTPQTIFEAGSVSKQFTAAAVALLAQDGKLSLDDPVRKYLPEVPDFGGQPIRIRNFLNHTSGLRSQWPLLTLAGRPPGSAVHTVGEILDLVSRQKELNFPPGEEFLYNNTGFTLLSVIVTRVSGQSFQQFCETRLFTPIGMTSTRWREDHTTVVKGRATAYGAARDGSFRTEMSFTNVIGNGGLLTTVGDLVLWNQNLDNPKVGGPRMVEQLETPGVLNDGFVNEYAEGLMLRRYRGLKEISHGGSTAGYRTFLARFPEKQLSVAVLCNVGAATPEVYGHQLVDIFLENEVGDRGIAPAIAMQGEELKSYAGLYREPSTDAVERLVVDKEKLRVGGGSGGELTPIGPKRFRNADGRTEYVFERASDSNGATRVREATIGNTPRLLVAVAPATPSPADLAAYAGVFYSDELDITYNVWADAGKLMLRHRPEPGAALVPLYADAFDFGQGRVIRFTRDQAGHVDGLQIYAGRVRHLKFIKRPAVV
jgi:CubicO group peptidase (beta-lactamase class C family)